MATQNLLLLFGYACHWVTDWLTHSLTCLVDLMAMNDTNCLMLSQQLLKAMNILFYEQVTLVSRTQSSGPLCLWQCFHYPLSTLVLNIVSWLFTNSTSFFHNWSALHRANYQFIFSQMVWTMGMKMAVVVLGMGSTYSCLSKSFSCYNKLEKTTLEFLKNDYQRGPHW